MHSQDSMNGAVADTFLDYYGYLVSYCNFLSGNKWDGEDLAHDTFIKAFKMYDQSVQYKKALLMKMANHRWIDKQRTNHSASELFEHMEQLEYQSNIFERKAALEYLLDKLTVKQAVIYILKEVFLFRIKEIADILSSSEASIKASLHRSRNNLAGNNKKTANYYESETETGILLEVLDEAISIQDPTLLITNIPYLLAIKPNIMPVEKSNHNPSFTLILAA